MTRITFCHLCGRQIRSTEAAPPGTGQARNTGKSTLFRHPQWPRGLSLRVCNECLLTKPRCRVCGLPMAEPSQGLAAAGTPSRQGPVCATCSASLKICLCCGKEINQTLYRQGKGFLEFDGVGPYCQDCYENRPPCDICSAPLTSEHWRLSDGRTMCVHCHRTAIFTPKDAGSLYEEMKAAVAKVLGLQLNIPTGLALVDRNQLAQIITTVLSDAAHNGAEEAASDDPGAELPQIADAEQIQRTLGIYTRKGIRRGIYVQTGLPRLLFLQVAAHEYAHAWQGENCPLLAGSSSAEDKVIHEGFAEWVAYKVLGHYGYRRGQERMFKRTDLYGDGLRWALEAETRCGTQAVLDACRNFVAVASVNGRTDSRDEGQDADGAGYSGVEPSSKPARLPC